MRSGLNKGVLAPSSSWPVTQTPEGISGSCSPRNLPGSHDISLWMLEKPCLVLGLQHGVSPSRAGTPNVARWCVRPFPLGSTKPCPQPGSQAAMENLERKQAMLTVSGKPPPAKGIYNGPGAPAVYGSLASPDPRGPEHPSQSACSSRERLACAEASCAGD